MADSVAAELLDGDPHDEEVRVALALNGGVSLAVWMGGCVVELDCARRAHLAAEPASGDVASRTVYHGLCRAFARVLVIDIMTGASAGGINGGLLAAAIRHRRRLPADFIRDRWLALGELSRLLQRTSNPSPTALMQGREFFEDLQAAFEAVIEDEAGPTALPVGQAGLDELDVKLDVTTTNLVGERRSFQDFWGRELVAREYRARFSFRERGDYTATALAVAGRSSASFPFAFEPWRVDCQSGALAGFPEVRWVVDGGLLDNAPIATAIALIPTRGALRQVRRFLCYMNAEPPQVEPVSLDGEQQPSLQQVAAYVLNLPRKAPFVDQLTAIERATRRGLFKDKLPELELLKVDLRALEQTAEGLLPSYRRRRLMLSVEELLGEAAAADTLIRSLPEQFDVPWLPHGLIAYRDGAWQWGISPAQRTVQLIVEMIGRAAEEAPIGPRLGLFEARGRIDIQRRALAQLRRRPVDMASSGTTPLQTLELAMAEMVNIDPIRSLRAVASITFAVADDLDPQHARGLFGDGWREEQELSDERFKHFLARTLAIEVVRRSLVGDEEIETAQELRFAQLTPYAPGLIFTPTPSTETGWATPEEKLTGLGLGHFAGFYRRSWRANDFMWGRLDAAARVVDLLVAPGRARQLSQDGISSPSWEALADALLQAEPQREQHWLLHEALGDHLSDYPLAGASVPSAGDLRRELVTALEADLMVEDISLSGRLTRILFTRAAQLEVFHHELARLKVESAADEKLGAGVKAIALSDDTRSAIEQLRSGPTLPARLTGADEAASALALRTGAHAGLVGLAMLRTTGLPLKRALFSLRALLLPVAGTVAQSRAYRAGVLIAFWSVALFLARRLLSTHEYPARVGLLISPAQLTTLIALLVVVGVAFVPGFRAALAEKWWRKLREALWALSILATGAIAAVLLAHFAGGRSWSQLLVAPGAHEPPEWLLWAAIGFVVGAPIGAIPALVRGFTAGLLSRPWGGITALVLAVLIAGLLGGFSIVAVASQANAAEWWRAVIALLALLGAPICAAGYLFVRRER
jgi:predicted acylesterase/phospholipase RssA